jgi:benzoyl-CoA reductase subunit D
MLVAGIDAGAKNVHVVLIGDGEVVALAAVPSGFDHEESAGRGLATACGLAGVELSAVARIAATGSGRKALAFAADQPTEIAAGGRGASALYPGARTVVDVGADEARAIRLGPAGNVVDFAINEKCAAGAGAFVEAMSRALEMPLDAFAKASLNSTEVIPMNAQCTVFAESEVVSLIQGLDHGAARRSGRPGCAGGRGGAQRGVRQGSVRGLGRSRHPRSPRRGVSGGSRCGSDRLGCGTGG